MFVKASQIVALYMFSTHKNKVTFQELTKFEQGLEAAIEQKEANLAVIDKTNPVYLCTKFYLSQKELDNDAPGLFYCGSTSIKLKGSVKELKETLKPLPRKFLKPALEYSKKCVPAAEEKDEFEETFMAFDVDKMEKDYFGNSKV